MSLNVNVGGSFEEASGIWVNDEGTWRQGSSVWVNNFGTWVQKSFTDFGRTIVYLQTLSLDTRDRVRVESGATDATRFPLGRELITYAAPNYTSGYMFSSATTEADARALEQLVLAGDLLLELYVYDADGNFHGGNAGIGLGLLGNAPRADRRFTPTFNNRQGIQDFLRSNIQAGRVNSIIVLRDLTAPDPYIRPDTISI